MKKSTVALIVVLGIAGVVVVAGAIFAAGYFLINGISSRPASEKEKKLVVDAAALVEYGARVDPKCGRYTTTRNLDATTNVNYECASDSLYVLSDAEINPNVRDARQGFVLGIGAYKASVAIGGTSATLHRRDSLLGNLGDDRYAAMIRSGGKDIGNLFIVRKGRVVYSLLISGLYFDDSEPVQELVGRAVEAGEKEY